MAFPAPPSSADGCKGEACAPGPDGGSHLVSRCNGEPATFDFFGRCEVDTCAKTGSTLPSGSQWREHRARTGGLRTDRHHNRCGARPRWVLFVALPAVPTKCEGCERCALANFECGCCDGEEAFVGVVCGRAASAALSTGAARGYRRVIDAFARHGC
jgi:hypothetical protein